jgi:hypothetical protein
MTGGGGGGDQTARTLLFMKMWVVYPPLVLSRALQESPNSLGPFEKFV